MYYKITIVLVLALICVNAAPADQPAATILKYEYEPNANSDGGYRLEYEISDGQTRSEVASVKYVGEENIPILSVSGVYSYVAPDGVTYKISYLADENGFAPTGDHLPSNAVNNPSDTTSGQVPAGPPPEDLPPNTIASLVG